MGVSKSAANKGKKTHEAKPHSKLSQQKHVVKPESRELGTKMSVGSAQNFVNKIFR